MLSVVKVLLLFQITVTINNNLMIFMNIMTKGECKRWNLFLLNGKKYDSNISSIRSTCSSQRIDLKPMP